MRKLLGFFIAVLFLSNLSAQQDTLTIMHYNVLNYGNTSNFCPESKYPLSNKSKYIRTIIDYVKPDIVSFNEVSPEPHFHDSLANALQNGNSTAYKLAPATNLAKSNLVNLLFYNTEKVALHSAKVIRHSLRDINVYRMYYKDLQPMSDTVFFTCIVAHLKAGSGKDDATTRASMTNAIMEWLQRESYQNYFLMGDFNLYSSTEEAYQTLTSGGASVRFFDPLDREGNWHDNSSYANIHTQSTRLANTGCFAQGGLDDRFDFILFNETVKESALNVSYLSDSYHAVGNTGGFFNDSVHYVEGMSVSKEVMEALRGNSDHLPVTLKIAVETSQRQTVRQGSKHPRIQVSISNPVAENLLVWIQSDKKEQFKLHIRDTKGSFVMEQDLSWIKGQETKSIPLHHLPCGIYILTIVDGNGIQSVKKFVKR